MKTVVILERRDCKNVFYLAFSFLIIFFFLMKKTVQNMVSFMVQGSLCQGPSYSVDITAIN